MSMKTCPICDAEILKEHNCADYDFSKISIEMELLDLNFDLEPYEAPSEYIGSNRLPARKANADGEEKRSAPMFLRM
ncbi:MAG: hypothetical protein FWG88_02895 [Oscillospiraceae bacterium]|nr:hypothetical protein [Oscillospiraceae bacterium]